MRSKFDPALIPPTPDLRVEQALWAQGLVAVAGVDEAGRGAWAGPVSAAAVVLPCADLLNTLSGVRDSKQMTPEAREHWSAAIRAACLGWGVGFASHAEIDALGILPATRLAACRALEQLSIPPAHIILDFLTLPQIATPQTPLVKGDARCLTIACASVLAKTARDARMRELDAAYPGYGFAKHKGYGTAAHQASLERLGPCEIHRKSFAPVKALIDQGTVSTN